MTRIAMTTSNSLKRSSEDSSLLGQSATRLVADLTAGRLSACELLDAYHQRVRSVNPLINALVAERWEAARAEAQQADLAQQRGQPLGILHGLPITIKEMFDVAGFPTTAGIKRRLKVNATRDAEVVRRLRCAGAIVIGKTNVPQLGMLAESDNPIYGRTNNPWNLDRGPGGSSGGEAAMIAAAGSPLGLGSDGAGSIRQPAHACGICGFKPTGGRLSMQGHWLSSNWPADWAAPGPLARYAEDLQLAFRALCSEDGGGPGYGGVPMESQPVTPPSLGQLRVGVYEQLEELPAAESVRRAVREAATALESAEIEVVPFRWERAGAIWDLFIKIFYAEGLQDMQRQMRGSPHDWRVRRHFQLAKLPGWMRGPSSWISSAYGQSRMAHSLRTLRRPALSVAEYCSLLAEVHGWRLHFARQLKRHKIDALIGPVSPVPAFRHGEFHASSGFIYTGIYNLLGVPAGVVPVTQVDHQDGASPPNSRDAVDQLIWRSQQDSHGLPVGVQIVGPWWSDDRVLALMYRLQQLLDQDFSLPTAVRT